MLSPGTYLNLLERILCVCMCYNTRITQLYSCHEDTKYNFNYFPHKYIYLNKWELSLYYQPRTLPSQIWGLYEYCVALNKCTYDLPQYKYNTGLIAKVKLIFINCS